MEARFAAFLAGKISKITIDGITFYWWCGKICTCKAKRPECSGKNYKWTPGRVENTGNFQGKQRHAQHVVRDVYDVLPVWECAWRDRGNKGMTYDNYRHQATAECVGANGVVKDFRHFKASEGRLSLPAGMTATRGKEVVWLWWNDTRDKPAACPDDVLHVLFFRESVPDALQFAEVSASTRADGWATFAISLEENDTLHLYPFFGTADNDGFSPNEYFNFRF
ncbi:hypothetical protein AALK14_13365 [Butyricimonas hominis]|uniref:hypothetical protein n=1 Tax=Butyricimonas TaxID=574697 RepID=UPI0035186018